ncbi:MAG: hypothetical protein P4L50_25795 [Anaerolineaceae bacterium]|nr:hypothetical protein [Anaerolineaceae bacterium]
MFRKIRIPFEIVLVLIVFITHLYVALGPENSLINWFPTDDAFYYYKTAQNVSEGFGFTFDRINQTNGFHPLWEFICIPVFALARFNLVLPLRVLIGLMGLINAAIAILIFRLLTKILSKEVSALMALFWILTPRIFNVTDKLGMESGISALSILILISLVTRLESNYKTSQIPYKEYFLMGIAAVFTVLSRLDNIFVVALVGIWLVFRSSNIRYFLICDFLLTLGSVLASYVIRLGLGPTYYQYLPSLYWMLAISILVRVVVYYFFGLYKHPQVYTSLQTLLRSAVAATLASGIISLLMFGLFMTHRFVGFPRVILLTNWGFVVVAAVMLHLAAHWVTRSQDIKNPLINPDIRLKANWKPWLAGAASYFGPVGVALIIYMGWSMLTFGTATPVSGQIKQWWGTLANSVYGTPVNSVDDYMGLLPDTDNGPWSLGIWLYSNPATTLDGTFFNQKRQPLNTMTTAFGLLTGLLCLLLIIKHWQFFKRSVVQLGLIPLLAACLIHVVYYKATGYVNTRNWYWIEEIICVTLFASLVAEMIFRTFENFRLPKPVIQASLGVLILAMLINAGGNYLKNFPWDVPADQQDAYLGGVEALQNATPPGSRIGSTGGGTIAYFIQDRTIVNMDGLMNSYQYFQQMKNGTGGKALDAMGLTYVYGNKYVVTASDPYFSLLHDRLTEIGDVSGSMLFKYKAPAAP